MTSICNYYNYMWTGRNPLKDKSREIRDNILSPLKQCCYRVCTFLRSSETKDKRKGWNLTTCRSIHQSGSLILWSWVEYKIFPREDNLISTGTVRTGCSLSVVRSTVAAGRTAGTHDKGCICVAGPHLPNHPVGFTILPKAQHPSLSTTHTRSRTSGRLHKEESGGVGGSEAAGFVSAPNCAIQSDEVRRIKWQQLTFQLCENYQINDRRHSPLDHKVRQTKSTYRILLFPNMSTPRRTLHHFPLAWLSQ